MSEDNAPPGPRGRGDAESLAIQVFDFIAQDVDRIIQFMNVTGLQPETLRESANTPGFLVGILDYVSKDEELVKAVHQALGIAPQAILTAAGHLAPVPESGKAPDKAPESRSQLPRRSLFR